MTSGTILPMLGLNPMLTGAMSATVTLTSGGAPLPSSGSWTGTVTVGDNAGSSGTSPSITISVGPALAITGTPPTGGEAAAYGWSPTISSSMERTP